MPRSVRINADAYSSRHLPQHRDGSHEVTLEECLEPCRTGTGTGPAQVQGAGSGAEGSPQGSRDGKPTDERLQAPAPRADRPRRRAMRPAANASPAWMTDRADEQHLQDLAWGQGVPGDLTRPFVGRPAQRQRWSGPRCRRREGGTTATTGARRPDRLDRCHAAVLATGGAREQPDAPRRHRRARRPTRPAARRRRRCPPPGWPGPWR